MHLKVNILFRIGDATVITTVECTLQRYFEVVDHYGVRVERFSETHLLRDLAGLIRKLDCFGLWG